MFLGVSAWLVLRNFIVVIVWLVLSVKGVFLLNRDISCECVVGASCSFAVLTEKIGVYRCPFGSCMKREVSQKR